MKSQVFPGRCHVLDGRGSWGIMGSPKVELPIRSQVNNLGMVWEIEEYAISKVQIIPTSDRRLGLVAGLHPENFEL